MERHEVFYFIDRERRRQESIHPGSVEDEFYFLAVLMEEVGEVAQALQEGSNLTEELLHVAAVCTKWLESRP